MLTTLICLACFADARPLELPPVVLEDARRFGPASYESCRAVVEVLEEYERLLERQLGIECVAWRAAQLQVSLDQLHVRSRAWELLAYALEPCFSPEWRHECLAELRELLGPEAYYRGEMPPFLPQ